VPDEDAHSKHDESEEVGVMEGTDVSEGNPELRG